MKTIRVYADTSVFGGVYDEDFEEESREFFSEVKRNRFTLVTSAVVQAEIIDISEESLSVTRRIFGSRYCYSKVF